MTVKSNPTFDARVNIPLKFPSEDGFKTIVVRQPSDEQLCRRASSRKVIIKDLGRGASESESVVNELVDSEIFAEMKLSDETATVDAAEAAAALDRVTDVGVTHVNREGSRYRVSLEVLGNLTVTEEGKIISVLPAQCVVEHVIKMPSQRQIMDYRRGASRSVSLPFGKREFRINIDVAAALYDKLLIESKGYAEGSPIPINHKAEVLSATIQVLERELAGEAMDPTNF